MGFSNASSKRSGTSLQQQQLVRQGLSRAGLRAFQGTDSLQRQIIKFEEDVEGLGIQPGTIAARLADSPGILTNRQEILTLAMNYVRYGNYGPNTPARQVIPVLFSAGFTFDAAARAIFAQLSGTSMGLGATPAALLHDAITKKRFQVGGQKPIFWLAISVDAGFDAHSREAAGFLGYLRSIKASREAKLMFFGQNLDCLPKEFAKDLIRLIV